ncbi:hypothetical protein ACO0R3_001023 [Hanseniaspora guilliermondii]
MNYKSNEEKEFKLAHTKHLYNQFVKTSENRDIFPKELSSLYFVKLLQSSKKNKLILPEELRGKDLGKIRKTSKWKYPKTNTIKPKDCKENGPSIICNDCYEYMIPGKTYKQHLKDDNTIIKKCLKCGYEKNIDIKKPESKQVPKQAETNKKQKLKNKNKLIIHQKLKQKKDKEQKAPVSMNLMDFLS